MLNLAELLTVQSAAALLTLTILEIVLGVDNIIFLAIVTQDLPKEQQPFARKAGLGLALVGRIAMVLGASWLLGLQRSLFTALGHGFSVKDLILLAGGLFLSYKAVTEIYKTTELKEEATGGPASARPGMTMAATILQVAIVDMVFAIDSVPAIFALTREPMIVFTSNVFAILGLRSLYFLLAGAVERFALLKYGLALVLVFVGLKMVWLNDAFGGKFPIGWSLGIIGSVIAASIVWSMLATRSTTKNTLWKENKEDEVVVENRNTDWN